MGLSKEMADKLYDVMIKGSEGSTNPEICKLDFYNRIALLCQSQSISSKLRLVFQIFDTVCWTQYMDCISRFKEI